MKILMTIKRLENMAGGAERIFLQVANGLHEHGYDVGVATFDPEKATSFYPFPEGVKWKRIAIGDNAKPAKILETIKRIYALHRLTHKFKPDCIIAFQHSMMIPSALSFPPLKTVMIGSEHIVPDHYKTRLLQYAAFLFSALRFTKITAVTDEIIQTYPDLIRRKMVAIANPVTPTKGKADPAGDDAAVKAILSVGRLDAQKDHSTLIRAFASLSGDFPDWHLKIIGEGPLRGALESDIRQLGLEDRIFMPGITKDVAEEYTRAHIFALPSLYESFGLATAEAMSAGLPVLGFADCPGTNTLIIDDENGVLCEVDKGTTRVRAFAASLRALMEDPVLRKELGANGIIHARQFDIDAIVSEWVMMLKAQGITPKS